MEITGLKDKVAIVTAAGQNIGKSVALAFAKAGAHVVLNGLSSQKKIDAVAEEARSYGVKALPILADASNPEAVQKMVDEAVKQLGAIHIAVATVGIRPHQAFHDISIEDWHRVINTNLGGTFYLDRAVLPYMRRQKYGRIIHMSGTDGLFALPNRAHVMATKHGMHALAKAIALEYGPEGITANSIAPGWLYTERNPEWYPNLKETIRHFEETLPVRELGTADDIANACIYLASDMGKFVTGHMIHINGGEFMV